MAKSGQVGGIRKNMNLRRDIRQRSDRNERRNTAATCSLGRTLRREVSRTTPCIDNLCAATEAHTSENHRDLSGWYRGLGDDRTDPHPPRRSTPWPHFQPTGRKNRISRKGITPSKLFFSGMGDCKSGSTITVVPFGRSPANWNELIKPFSESKRRALVDLPLREDW